MRRKILIVDDNNINRLLLGGMLSDDYDVLEAENGADALAMLGEDHANVSAVLLDISMPVMDGYEALRRIRSSADFPTLPVIMITGSDDEETRIKSLTLGANDFVMKPYSEEIIKHCLQNTIAFQEAEATVEALLRDRLTGVFNQDTFYEKSAAMIGAQPEGYYTLCSVDISGFKVVNDQHGRSAGDEVLKALASVLAQTSHECGGICGRISADNFVALRPSEYMMTHTDIATVFCAFIERETGVKVAVSVGRYIVDDKSLSVSAMYDRAKIAQSTVKGRFDTCVAVFDESMLTSILHRQKIVSEMSAALKDGQFEVWFQPQYNHSTGALIGAEALVRWLHPVMGMIPPNDFISIFEDNGFIYTMDQFVWEQVCRYLRRWLDEGRTPLPISVNISRFDMLCPDLIQVITGLVEKYSIPIGLLRLEITESAFSRNTEAITSVVRALVDNGFTVEIDDFGSGYSSLNTLKDVPAQIIKLDMKFLQSSNNSRRGGNIVESVVRMANWLGLSIIAEGVEMPSQADYLASIGCYYVQGYLYARPMSAVDYAALAHDHSKEQRIITLETADNLDNNSFWDPDSMDTLIFNSYVGAACIFEYFDGRIDLIRVSKKYTRLFADSNFGIEVAMQINWADYMDAQSKRQLYDLLIQSIMINDDVTCEFTFHNLPWMPEEVYLRFNLRVIAATELRMMVYCIYENITQQRIAEMREENLSTQLQTVLDNISSGVTVVMLREDGNVEPLMLTDKYLDLLGYTRKQFDREVTDLFSPLAPEDSERVRDICADIVKTGQTQIIEFRAIRRDGRSIWLQDTISMAKLAGVDGMVQIGVFADITQQKKADEAARMRAEEYRIAILSSGKLIYRYNHSDHSADLPADVAYAFGLSTHRAEMPESMISKNIVLEDSVEQFRELFRAIERGDSTGCITAHMKNLRGDDNWFRISFNNVFDNEGVPTSAIIVFDDVTEQREKEAVYEKWQNSLADRPPESFTLYRWNLNKEKLLSDLEGSLLSFRSNVGDLSFTERTEQFCQTYVHPDDRDSYFALMNPHILLANYQLGKRSDSLEYRALMPNGEVLWLRLTVELFEYVNSTDVCAYIMYENIDEAKKKELLIQRQAETDPLTGLLNRKAFEEKFRIIHKKRSTRTIRSALLIIDIDGFKLVNDTFGHAIGDETLIEIAIKLRENFREQDLLCRLGGDEYLICMYDVPNISTVRGKAALLCALLHKSFDINVQISASIGVTLFTNDNDNFETLYSQADAALYHIKGSGKDGYAIFDEEMKEVSDRVSDADIPAPVISQATGAVPRRRMLIVDDNEVNLDYLTSLFMDDFIIETAQEGTAALVRLKRYGAGISIVLLDLRMPGMDGFSVLKNMRDNLATQAIPVIVVSGLDEQENALKAIREGANDFITKPVDADLLRLRVASALSKADNEQLRAQNRFLALQNEESKRLAEAKRHSEELSVALLAAEQADIAKTQFLSSMSHEIRTPLNAIIGFNNIARSEMSAAKDVGSGSVSMKVMDCLTKSDIASKQLLMIINDILDISAIEAGKMRLEDAPFDFRSLITSLTVMFFSQARSKGVNFDVVFDKPTEEWFSGDQLRLNQVLTNLLSNAVKFTPEGGSVTLAITELHQDDTAAAFRFVVSDTGIGMTPEYLEHIWTPFEQAEASISRRFGGSGLGLSITKSIVDLMGGTITVQSASGFGSSFTVELSFKRTEQPLVNSDGDFSDIRALVVDDDVSTCDYIKLMFDRCGAYCMTCISGAKAVEAFAAAKDNQTPFNLCLVDWKMPQMDGFSTICEIRRLAGKKLPIVVVTAYDFSDVAEHAEKLGINKFISKPLFQSSLFDLLSTVSERQLSSISDIDTKYDFNGARVMLVEDNSMNMEVAKQILLSANLAVDSAWNGQEAVEIFLASRPGTYKAIFMDVHMPVVDGYQATRMIRSSAHPDAETVPIIAMTADVFAEDIEAAQEVGMNDHIAKPVDVDALYKLLSAYIKEKEV